MIPPDGCIVYRLPSAMGRMEQGVVKLDFATAFHFSPSYGDFCSAMQVKETSILDCLDFMLIYAQKMGTKWPGMRMEVKV